MYISCGLPWRLILWPSGCDDGGYEDEIVLQLHGDSIEYPEILESKYFVSHGKPISPCSLLMDHGNGFGTFDGAPRTTDLSPVFNYILRGVMGKVTFGTVARRAGPFDDS